MNNEILYDIAIIGGGVGGLTLAIQLAKQHYRVILFEKERYPFHKVCGEYISLESKDFLESLGWPLQHMNLPVIKKLNITSPDGTILKANLPLGGFGISRYTIDNDLKNIAVQAGVTVLENCKAEEAVLVNEIFNIQTTAGEFKSRVCCGSFGKRSNLDIKWKRSFITRSNNKLNDFVGFKYHIQTNFAMDTIALHNFKNGYCGISKIEDDKYCLCCLSSISNLKESNNSFEQMEKNVLSRNPFLKNIFENSTKLFKQPVTISHISFNQKTQVENNILLLGDAAGMITPLCGNGMSMAMHAGKIAAGFISAFLQGKISRQQMEMNYTTQWKKTFAKRLRTGRMIQRFFRKIRVTNLFVKAMKLSPSLTRLLIRQTHGESF